MRLDRPMIAGTSKIIWFVLLFWRVSPLTLSHIGRAPTSPISSGVARKGPSGAKVSWLLPFDHWPPRSRRETADSHSTRDPHHAATTGSER